MITPIKHTQADMDKESKKLLDLLRPSLEVTRSLEGPKWPSESLVRALMGTIKRIKFNKE